MYGQLIEKTVKELRELAKELHLSGSSKWKKEELIQQIQKVIDGENQVKTSDHKNDKASPTAEGILDLHSDGYGFLRSDEFISTEDDIYVAPTQIRKFNLKTGDFVQGPTRRKKEGEKFAPLMYIQKINNMAPEEIKNRPDFDALIPIFPVEKLKLEWDGGPLSNRIIDIIAPIGKGQRGLIVSPPKSGKTTLLKSIAQAVERNHPEVKLFVLLIDERPEEVTDIARSIRSKVVASTFDEEPENHIRLSEFVLDRCKRLVEQGEDVMILLDSITRLTRAYNLTSPSSGKTLSGGIDPTAFYKPKRFFGAARKLEDHGSLTILATALIDTGSRMDDVIYEEFKGTGNMEVHLNRELSEMRIFPAIDLFRSGTRREELLLSQREYETMRQLRWRMMHGNTVEIANDLLKAFQNTKNNEQLVQFIAGEMR